MTLFVSPFNLSTLAPTLPGKDRQIGDHSIALVLVSRVYEKTMHRQVVFSSQVDWALGAGQYVHGGPLVGKIGVGEGGCTQHSTQHPSGLKFHIKLITPSISFNNTSQYAARDDETAPGKCQACIFGVN